MPSHHHPLGSRPNARERGYTWQWEKARSRFLQEHPLCAMCERRGFIVAARVVDHIVPHRGDEVLFWDKANWQPLCRRCHDQSKKQQERGRGGPQVLDADGWPLR